MKPIFVRTKNVKNFITLTNNLINRAEGVPGMALVYGEPGLGKTRTMIWWASNNNAIYVSAVKTMTTRWLLEHITKAIGGTTFFRSSDLLDQIEKSLIRNPRVLIVDEIDYLVSNECAVEILRDIHDRTQAPVILVGMSRSNQHLKRFEHLYDRFSEVMHFFTI